MAEPPEVGEKSPKVGRLYIVIVRWKKSIVHSKKGRLDLKKGIVVFDCLFKQGHTRFEKDHCIF